jgi:O-antigen/teichoic acid export membrane protein
MQSAISLLDFGFTQTFSRNFAYVYCGAQSLTKEGFDNSSRGPVNTALLAATINAARRVYFIITLLAFVILSTVGTLYVINVSKGSGLSAIWSLIAWFIFSASAIFNIYLQWQTSLLLGADKIAKTYSINIISRLVQLVVSTIGLVIVPSVLVLVCAYALSILIARFYNSRAVKDILSKNLGDHSKLSQSPADITRCLWHNASRLGLVFLGSFLITRSCTFVIAHFLGLATLAQYSISMQIFMVAQSLAQVMFSSYYQKISGARVINDQHQIRTLFFRSLVFAWTIFCGTSIVAIIVGPELLDLMGSNTKLPSRGVLILMAVVALLEMNHSLCATAIVTGNRVPFVYASLLSGFTIISGTIAVGFAGGGVLEFVLVQGIIQLLYNNWKWPLMLFGELFRDEKANAQVGRIGLDG